MSPAGPTGSSSPVTNTPQAKPTPRYEVDPALRPRKRPSDSPRVQMIKTVAFVVLVAAIMGFMVMYFIGRHKRLAQRANCTGQCILLRASGADPEALTVTKGSFVEFATADGQRHSLVLDPLADPDHQHNPNDVGYQSRDFGPGESWKVQFKQDGSYAFIDKYNTNIKIAIVVYTPDKTYKVQ